MYVGKYIPYMDGIRISLLSTRSTGRTLIGSLARWQAESLGVSEVARKGWGNFTQEKMARTHIFGV